MVWSLIVTSTPSGISTGILPMRDTGAPPRPPKMSLPNVANHFAADAGFASFLVAHHALRRRQDGNAKATQHTGHLVPLRVDPQARAADPPDPRDDPLLVGGVLQENPKRRLRLVFIHELVIADKPFLLEDAGQLDLKPRGRDVHRLMEHRRRIANPRQHIGDGIRHAQLVSTPSSGPTTSWLW